MVLNTLFLNAWTILHDFFSLANQNQAKIYVMTYKQVHIMSAVEITHQLSFLILRPATGLNF